VFDLHGNERLAAWRQFRDSLEDHNNPLESVAEFWSHAPFVNLYLDPNDPKSWPDPWHIVLDLKLDDLAICLGMLYTLKLNVRFMDCECEIHMSMLSKNRDPRFFLVVDNSVLNYEPRKVHPVSILKNHPTTIIWQGKQLP
jgi:hypothetical protein